MIEIKKLNSGIKVVIEEIPYIKSVSFGIWVKNGSKYENNDNNGISHFIEHLIFKGTYKRNSKDIAEEMDKLGGQINAYTTKEYTCYHTRILNKHFEKAVEILSDMFLNSKFDNNDIKKEKNIILEEIYMYNDSPEELVHDKLQEAIWKNDSIGLPILGTENTINKFNQKNIKEYFKEHYINNNIVISIAGNIEKEKAFDILEKYFVNKNFKVNKKNLLIPKPTYIPSFIKNEKDSEQTHICICFPSFERDSKYKYDITVLNNILGASMSSILFQKIREENGLTYSIYSYISSYEDTGIFIIYASINPNQIEKVLNLIYKEINIIKKEKISKKIIDKTKQQIISNYIIGNESTINRMTSSGGSLLLRNYIPTEDEILENIENVNPESIQNITNKIFDFKNISISLAGNTNNIKFSKIIP